jgi:hypothetical protein
MALHKQVKVGGSFYKGYELLVSSPTGSYVIDMTLDSSCAINSISITPDVYGSGDTIKLSHMSVGSSSSLKIIADTIYNAGAGVSIAFDFPALEPMLSNEPLRLTYNNVAGKAIALHMIVEYVGIIKTS